MKRLAILWFALSAVAPSLSAQQRQKPAAEQQRQQPAVTQPRQQPNEARGRPAAAAPQRRLQPDEPVRPAAAAPQRQQPNDPVRPAAAAQNANANDRLLQALYVSEFQRQVGVNDELARKFQPMVMQWLQQRRKIVERRNAAVAELRRLVASDAPQSEITRQVSEIDQADNQTRNAERRLLTQVDPMLTPAQQARFRLFQVDMEQRIRELLDAARQPAAAQPIQPRPNRQGR